MRKKLFGRQLQRDTNERKALFKSLMEALVLRESIRTTEAKAKAVKGQVEKMVTKAKLGGDKAERALQQYFAPKIMKKLMEEVAPRFANRPGGYTRIIKLGNRFADNAQMVILEWVVKPAVAKNQDSRKETKTEEKLEAATPVEKSSKTKKTPAKKAEKKDTKPAAKKTK